MTFNYFKVIELLSNSHLKLLLKVYNYLFNFYYNYLFSTNFKYAYLIIPLYINNRYYFIFIISRID